MTGGLPDRFPREERSPRWEGPPDLAVALAEACREGEIRKDEAETLLIRWPGKAGATWWKLYRVGPGRRPLGLVARSRALREWRALCALHAAGIPAAPPLAFAEDRGPAGLRASLLVTREVDGRDLREWLLEGAPERDTETALLRAAGRAARRLHDAGFGHFRLQLRNLLAARRPPFDPVVVLDTPYTCCFPRPAPGAVRRVDLVDLAGAGSGLDPEQSRVLLAAYAGAGEPPLDLHALRHRRPWPQKLRRIGLYLLCVNTGHRPPPRNLAPSSGHDSPGPA